MRCECNQVDHADKQCDREAAEYDGVVTSPSLCVACLFACATADPAYLAEMGEEIP